MNSPTKLHRYSCDFLPVILGRLLHEEEPTLDLEAFVELCSSELQARTEKYQVNREKALRICRGLVKRRQLSRYFDIEQKRLKCLHASLRSLRESSGRRHRRRAYQRSLEEYEQAQRYYRWQLKARAELVGAAADLLGLAA